MSSIRRIQPASKFDPLFRRDGYAAVLRVAVPVMSITFILYILLRDLF